MDILLSSIIAFTLGIVSAILIERKQNVDKVLTIIKALSREIGDNQGIIDIARQLDVEKCIKDDFKLGKPNNDMYTFFKDDIYRLPAHIGASLTRYYDLISDKEYWYRFFTDREWNTKHFGHFLNTLELHSVVIMTEYFRPVMEAKTVPAKYRQTIRVLNAKDWPLSTQPTVNWERFEQLLEGYKANLSQLTTLEEQVKLLSNERGVEISLGDDQFLDELLKKGPN